MVEKPVKSLIVADIHFGFEAELAERGVRIPSQAWRLRDLLLEVVEEVDVERIIFLGDLKHLVPLSSRIEWREMPEALKELKKRGLELVLVPGNHDGDIELILGELVEYAQSRGLLLDGERKIFLIHGHAWPGPEALEVDLIIMGHLHPVISLRTDVGSVVRRKVWLYLNGDRKVLAEKLGVEARRRGRIGLIVMPAFNPILSGISVNSLPPRERLWPLIRSGAFDLDSAEAITLGGENLGGVRALRNLLMGEG
ncbi:MAG: metallophosphoesterase [Nitrososphaeria archaeon]|nr:metallophosphoesterase [Nitrososphaeria archaeon]